MTRNDAEEIIKKGRELKEKYHGELTGRRQLENFDEVLMRLEEAVRRILSYNWGKR